MCAFDKFHIFFLIKFSATGVMSLSTKRSHLSDGKKKRCGYDTAKRNSLNLRAYRYFLAVYIIFNLSTIYPSVSSLSRKLKEIVSLAKLAYSIIFCLAVVLVAITVNVIGFNLPKLLDLIGRENLLRKPQHFLIFLVNLPVEIQLIFSGISAYKEGDPMLAIYYFGYISRVFMHNIMGIMYLNALNILDHRVTDLLTSLQSSYCKMDILVKMKWKIRNRIANLNSLFSAFLGFIYARTFTEIIVAIESFVTTTKTFWFTLSCIARLSPLIVVYYVVHRSSQLMHHLVDVERLALRKLSEVNSFNGFVYLISSRHSCPFLQWQALRFDNNWDSPKVGRFVHNKQTFIGFLATCITFIAVVMQFDYRIVGHVRSLVDEYGKLAPL